MRRFAPAAAIALLGAGCRAPAPRPELPVAPAPMATRVAQILADARQAEHESDAAVRNQLAEDASRQADACLAAAPQAGPCLYGHAVALGLETRAHPVHANESLKRMLAELEAAEAADPGYDEGGPARVRALVLTRAPGWPLGPGDPAAGVIAARRAVELRGQYPPNLLALAEALAKSGDLPAAHAVYRQARDAAAAQQASADRDEWLREADQALQR